MPLSEFERKRIDKIFSDFCRDKIPAEYHDQLRIEYRICENEVTLYELRPHNIDPSHWFATPIARFTQAQDTATWQLFCPDRNGQWLNYPHCPPCRDIEKLLTEVKADPSQVFWG